MIVVCGEALFDVFATQERPAAVELSAYQGGSPFNLAIGVARLGGRASFFGGLSRDMFGRRLYAALAAEGVGLAAAPRPDAPTALVMVSVNDSGVPVYTFYGSGTAERAVSLADLERVPVETQAVNVGSYCMVVEPVASSLRALVEPRIEVWREALAWMMRRSDVLKVSEEDIHALYPNRRADTFIVEALCAGVALVVVTRGERGVIAATRSLAAVELSAIPVTVVDTVGAGDTFQAGLLAWLQHSGCLTRRAIEGLGHDELAAALRFAARAAAVTCSRRGADLPYMSELAGEAAFELPQS